MALALETFLTALYVIVDAVYQRHMRQPDRLRAGRSRPQENGGGGVEKRLRSPPREVVVFPQGQQTTGAGCGGGLNHYQRRAGG